MVEHHSSRSTWGSANEPSAPTTGVVSQAGEHTEETLASTLKKSRECTQEDKEKSMHACITHDVIPEIKGQRDSALAKMPKARRDSFGERRTMKQPYECARW